MKNYLYNRRMDSQPALFSKEILKVVFVKTPETPLDPPLHRSVNVLRYSTCIWAQ